MPPKCRCASAKPGLSARPFIKSRRRSPFQGPVGESQIEVHLERGRISRLCEPDGRLASAVCCETMPGLQRLRFREVHGEDLAIQGFRVRQLPRLVVTHRSSHQCIERWGIRRATSAVPKPHATLLVASSTAAWAGSLRPMFVIEGLHPPCVRRSRLAGQRAVEHLRAKVPVKLRRRIAEDAARASLARKHTRVDERVAPAAP